MGIEQYQQKIRDFSEWLKLEFVTEGCGDPKVGGCMSCEAVLATQSLDAMVRLLAAPSPQQQEMK
jgi:hypothetical protein